MAPHTELHGFTIAPANRRHQNKLVELANQSFARQIPGPVSQAVLHRARELTWLSQTFAKYKQHMHEVSYRQDGRYIPWSFPKCCWTLWPVLTAIGSL